MVGLYERPLSLTTITNRRSGSTAMLLSASQVMPPVRDPSPTMATTVRGSPLSANPLAMPSAHDKADDACELSTQSCSDSARLG